MKQECYGNLFPDLMHLRFNTPCKGKVFTVTLESRGVGIQSREVLTDREQWDQCQACPDYRSCYDLSMASTLLKHAVL